MQIYFLLLIVIILSGLACQSNAPHHQWPAENIKRYHFGNSIADSLSVGVNVDTNLVRQALELPGRTLVIFTGYTADHHNFLNHPEVWTTKVFEALRNWRVVVLYVDGRDMRNAQAMASVGAENSKFQIHRFLTAVQPQYVVVERGKRLCETGLLRTYSVA